MAKETVPRSHSLSVMRMITRYIYTSTCVSTVTPIYLSVALVCILYIVHRNLGTY